MARKSSCKSMNECNKWKTELRDPDVRVRAAAAENLCLAGAGSVDAAVELVMACGDHESVSQWAVAALEELGTPRLDSLDSLENLVKGTNPLVAYWAATLLGRLGPEASNSQEVLAEVLSSSEEISVRERAAWALGKIGATSANAQSALEQAASVGDQRLARLAQNALLAK